MLVQKVQDENELTVRIAYEEESGFIVSIPHYLYETGDGYNWRRVDGVTFSEEDISIDPISLADVQGWGNE